jgi:hypothetical protein
MVLPLFQSKRSSFVPAKAGSPLPCFATLCLIAQGGAPRKASAQRSRVVLLFIGKSLAPKEGTVLPYSLCTPLSLRREWCPLLLLKKKEPLPPPLGVALPLGGSKRYRLRRNGTKEKMTAFFGGVVFIP